MPARFLRSATWSVFLVMLLIVLVACLPSQDQTHPASDPETNTSTLPGSPVPTASVVELGPDGEQAAAATANILTEDNRPERLRTLTRDWNTNWNRRTVSYDEILSGGPPRDGIPSLDDPAFVNPIQAAEWLAGTEPVVALEINGDARAYPLQILTWHEIVNDTVGGIPVAVTFCPLCNAAITFDRRFETRVFEFGVSGLLRNSDLIMYDRTTETLWQQFTGDAIIGDLAGERLTLLPSTIISFEDFRNAYPAGQVLSRDTGFSRNYGRNPYTGYDTLGRDPFLYNGPLDGRLPAMARVVSVSLPGVDVAYPYPVLQETRVVNDTRAGQDLVIFFVPGTNSALGASVIADAEDVGSSGVFRPYLDDGKFTFSFDGEQIIDDQTSSVWNIAGQAIAGPLAGAKLEPVVHGDYFWFSWVAFKPDTIIYEGDSPAGETP